MFKKYFLVAITSLAISGCVESPRATGINEPDDVLTESTIDSNVQSTVIASSGGRAISPDGKFSILIGPRVFDSTIEMFIEQSEASEEGTLVGHVDSEYTETSYSTMVCPCCSTQANTAMSSR